MVCVSCVCSFRGIQVLDVRQLITLTDELVKSLFKGKHYELAILDFCKVFDRVTHKRLLRKQGYRLGAQWLSGRPLDSRPRVCGFEPHCPNCLCP